MMFVISKFSYSLDFPTAQMRDKTVSWHFNPY